MNISDPHRLIETLIALPTETEWLEFKENAFNPDSFGQYVSGLANSAMLHDQQHGYLVYGVKDKTHEIVGTTVRIKQEMKGNEPFEAWLAKLLHPTVHVEVVPFEYDGKHIEIVCIHPAYLSPVRFKSDAYIRISSTLKRLSDYPERERSLWLTTSRFTFERGVAAAHLSVDQVFDRFDVPTLLTGLGAARQTPLAMVERLVAEGLLNDDKQGAFDATNLLALLAAKDINTFPSLAGKTPRVVHYTGTSKLVAHDDVPGRLGYALSFTKVLAYIMARVSHKEEMQHGVRKTVYAIPEIALREFVANALIHQDLTAQGGGPMIEIYSDRIKITNPGKPLVDADRLIDAPARSRNEALAKIMMRLGYFEGRGSGVDRAIVAIEKEASMPPLFQVVENSMVVTVFYPRPFGAMSKEERVRACSQHASVRWEAGMSMSNQSLRDRFKLPEARYSQVSIVIADAKEAGAIKPLDEGQGNRNARYIPFWA